MKYLVIILLIRKQIHFRLSLRILIAKVNKIKADTILGKILINKVLMIHLNCQCRKCYKILKLETACIIISSCQFQKKINPYFITLIIILIRMMILSIVVLQLLTYIRIKINCKKKNLLKNKIIYFKILSNLNIIFIIN